MKALSSSQRMLRVVALTGLVFALLLLLLPDFRPPAGLWSVAIWNLLHLPVFFAITLMLAVLFPPGILQAKRVLFAVLGGVIIALMSELVQSMTGRSGSVRDLILDGLGIVLAAVWLHMKGRWSKLGWGFYLFSAGVILLAFLWPTVEVEMALRRHQQRLPDIGAFSHPDRLLLWKSLGNVELDSREGGAGLKVTIGKGAYGGVAYRPGMQDWSSFNELILKIENEGDPFVLGVRMDDDETQFGKRRSWYSTEVRVARGIGEIQIPLAPLRDGQLDAAIDLSRFTRLVLFTMNESSRREFVIKSAFLRQGIGVSVPPE